MKTAVKLGGSSALKTVRPSSSHIVGGKTITVNCLSLAAALRTTTTRAIAIAARKERVTSLE